MEYLNFKEDEKCVIESKISQFSPLPQPVAVVHHSYGSVAPPPLPCPDPCLTFGICVCAVQNESDKILPLSIVYPSVVSTEIDFLSLSYWGIPKMNISAAHHTVSVGEVLRLGLPGLNVVFWDFKILQITKTKDGSKYSVSYLGGSTENLPLTSEKKILCLRYLENLGQIADYPTPMDGTFLQDTDFTASIENINPNPNLNISLSNGFYTKKGKSNNLGIDIEITAVPDTGSPIDFSFEIHFSVDFPFPLNKTFPQFAFSTFNFTVTTNTNFLTVKLTSADPFTQIPTNSNFSISWID